MENTPRNGSQQQGGTRATPQGAAGSESRGDGGGSAQEREMESSRRPHSRPMQGGARTGRNVAPRQGYNPFATMMELSRQMDRLMDSFFGRTLGTPLGSRMGSDEGMQTPSLWQPQVDVQQRGDTLIVCADLPGVRKDDINIDVSEDGLTISGQRQEEREEGSAEQGYHLMERSYGSFYRTIPLPDGAKVEDAKASMRDGVLRIEVPLEKNSRRRQIRIES